MKTLRILLICAAVLALAAASVQAAEWYAVKHKLGETAITDQKPGPGWTVIGGPYKTKDEAARAAGIDPTKTKLEPIGKIGGKTPKDKWYVVKHKSGETAVLDSKNPGPGWTVVGGPYPNKAEAARAGGIDPTKVKLAPIGKTTAETKTGGNWYAVKHKSGGMAVIDYKPGPGWAIEGGPYKSKSEAARAFNIDLTKPTKLPPPVAGE